LKHLLICVLALSTFAAQSLTPEPLLDIVGFRLTPGRPNEASSRAVTSVDTASSRAGKDAISLEIKLLDLQRDVFTLGEPLIYEILLQNTGNTPLTLPWSPDRERFRNGSPERAFLLLEIRDATGKGVLGRLQPQALFGSKEVPDSVLTLAPGHRARIRVPAVLRTSEREMTLILEQPMAQVQLTAILLMQQQELRSTGSVVTVRP
jgi:hypothetical protein